MRRPPALLICLALVTGCAPLPLLQEATPLKKGASRSGVVGAAFVPVTETRYSADGGPAYDQPNLQYHPLLHLKGWHRVGLGGASEAAGAFELPTFTISAAGKLGILGTDPGDPFSLSLGADVGGSLVLGQVAWGGTLMASVRPQSSLSIDLSGRVGVWPGLWHLPAVTSTLGVSVGETDPIHVALGVVVPLLGERPAEGLRAAPGAFLMVGYTE